MPQRPEERLVPDSDVPNPVTPTKLLQNAGACQNNIDAEISVLSEENDAELESPPKKRTHKFKERKD
jgi:hypothetical protein